MTRAVVVVGLGWIAQKVHLPYLTSHPRVKIVGGHDLDEARLLEVCRRFGIVPLATLEEAIASTAEVVFVCTPPRTHAGLVAIAMQAGKHVVCEKPLATTSAEVDATRTVAQESDRELFCCMTNRYRDDVTLMAEAIAGGAIGEPVYVRGSWLRAHGIPSTTGALQQGALWDLGAHVIDTALWVTGWRSPIAVNASELSLANDMVADMAGWHRADPTLLTDRRALDTAILTAEFGGGRLLLVEVSWAARVPDDRTEVTVAGTEGALRLTSVFGWSTARDRLTEPALCLLRHGSVHWKPLKLDHDVSRGEYRAQLDHFFSSIHMRARAQHLEATFATCNLLASARPAGEPHAI